MHKTPIRAKLLSKALLRVNGDGRQLKPAGDCKNLLDGIVWEEEIAVFFFNLDKDGAKGTTSCVYERYN